MGYIGFFKSTDSKLYGVAFGSGVTFSTPEVTVSAEEQTVTAKLLFVNCPVQDVTLEAEGSFVTELEQDGSTVTFTIVENTSSQQRTATIAAVLSEEEYAEIVVKQECL